MLEGIHGNANIDILCFFIKMDSIMELNYLIKYYQNVINFIVLQDIFARPVTGMVLLWYLTLKVTIKLIILIFIATFRSKVFNLHTQKRRFFFSLQYVWFLYIVIHFVFCHHFRSTLTCEHTFCRNDSCIFYKTKLHM